MRLHRTVLIVSASLRYTILAIPWQAPLIAAIVSTVLVLAGVGDANVWPLQVAAVLLAGAAGFALDDPAYELLAASPTSLWRRRAARMAAILTPTILLWGTLAAVLGTESSEETLTLVAMLAGLLGLAFGVSGVAGRRTGGQGGPFTAPAILMALIASSTMPERWRPLPMGDIPGGWTALQTRWSAAAIVGVVVLLLSSRDAATRRLFRAMCACGNRRAP